PTAHRSLALAPATSLSDALNVGVVTTLQLVPSECLLGRSRRDPRSFGPHDSWSAQPAPGASERRGGPPRSKTLEDVEAAEHDAKDDEDHPSEDPAAQKRDHPGDDEYQADDPQEGNGTSVDHGRERQ